MRAFFALFCKALLFGRRDTEFSGQRKIKGAGADGNGECTGFNRPLLPLNIPICKGAGGHNAEGKVVLELKSVVTLGASRRQQIQTCLRLTGLTKGLLLNFGAERMKDGMMRAVNGLKE